MKATKCCSLTGSTRSLTISSVLRLRSEKLYWVTIKAKINWEAVWALSCWSMARFRGQCWRWRRVRAWLQLVQTIPSTDPISATSTAAPQTSRTITRKSPPKSLKSTRVTALQVLFRPKANKWGRTACRDSPGIPRPPIKILLASLIWRAKIRHPQTIHVVHIAKVLTHKKIRDLTPNASNALLKTKVIRAERLIKTLRAVGRRSIQTITMMALVALTISTNSATTIPPWKRISSKLKSRWQQKFPVAYKTPQRIIHW